MNWIIKLSIFILAVMMVGSMLVPSIPAQAQSGQIPAPHLGYGLHLDPNVPVDPAMVDELGMDWVKLYTESQIALFPNKRILFRQDLSITTDYDALYTWMQERARILDAQGVEAVEIHNEPNLSLEWNDQPPDAAQYVQMLRASYQAVKSVAPNMIVVSGGLAPTDTTPDRLAVNDIDYAREMLRNGAAQWFDAFGYHPYGFNAPPESDPGYRVLNFRRTELIWDLLRQFGVSDKQIWLTEFGWVRDPIEDGVQCADDDPEFIGVAWFRVDGFTQGEYIVRAFAYADRNWEWAGPSFLWNLNFSQRADDGSLAICNHMRWFGLLKRDGTRTEAFFRVAQMPKRYSNYLPTMKLYADDMTYETSVLCPNVYTLGSFTVGNTGYPGNFSASITPAQAPYGPVIITSRQTASVGQQVNITVDTTGLDPSLYLVYVNVRATIGGEITSQAIRGFLIVREGVAGEPCAP